MGCVEDCWGIVAVGGCGFGREGDAGPVGGGDDGAGGEEGGDEGLGGGAGEGVEDGTCVVFVVFSRERWERIGVGDCEMCEVVDVWVGLGGVVVDGF